MEAVIRSLDHIQLAIPPGAEDDARKFYCGVLGFVEVPKPADLVARGGCWFEQGSVRLHLGVEKAFAPAKKAHPGFIVGNMGALRARLLEAGAPIVEDGVLPGYEQIYSSDPFGNRLEFMSPLG